MAAAFPSACGKTNLAMMNPTLAGWRVECVGDDIAWMKFDSEGEVGGVWKREALWGAADLRWGRGDLRGDVGRTPR